MNRPVYISIDANEIGKRLENYILTGELSELSIFSKKILSMIETLRGIIESKGGHVFMAGGDNLLADIPEREIDFVMNEVSEMNDPSNIRFSIGIGDTPANAYIALKYSKASGLYCIKYGGDVFETIRE